MKQRKTRVSKSQVRKMREETAERKSKTSYRCKTTINPGPYTNLKTELIVNVKLRYANDPFKNQCRGTYKNDDEWSERSWYPIVINITSDTIKEDVMKYGLEQYLTACERSFTTEENKAEFGVVIILKCIVNKSMEESDRFISCYAKTNKKTIKGFSSYIKGNYKIL